MAVLEHLDVASLTILVGGIIGDVDFLPVIPFLIPSVKEINTAPLGHGGKKLGNL
ncbi:hypothetical protein SDC9_118698 [bioreactor metagenome]|uniref:Uncharacterized protein n=1 Tax=bioreactor metagenome TaxID=1076179 RepID=A0A645C2Z6_9ZZZZ